MKGGSRVIVEPHRDDGVFVAKGKEDALVTTNMVNGESVYGEKRIAVQVLLVVACLLLAPAFQNEDGIKFEYRVWNPFRSKLDAAILGGVDNKWIANCIDTTVPAEAVFTSEVKKWQADLFKPFKQVTLEQFEHDHACIVGGYRMPKKRKSAAT